MDFHPMNLFDNLEISLALLALVSAAAISDLRTRKIPNRLLLTGLLIGLVLSLMTRGIEGLVSSLAGFGLGFILLLPGYLLRFTGAGDVKLLATLGVFTGPGMLLHIFLASILTGALFVLLQALWKAIINNSSFLQRYQTMLQTLLTTGQFNQVPSGQDSVLKQRLPMAPFYALGCLIILMFPLI
jgi:prepilin peptidase CpaA